MEGCEQGLVVFTCNLSNLTVQSTPTIGSVPKARDSVPATSVGSLAVEITSVSVPVLEEEGSGALLPHLAFLVQEVVKLRLKSTDLLKAEPPFGNLNFSFRKELT